MIALNELSEKDLPSLYDFYDRNWDFFNQFLPEKPIGYKCLRSFSLLHKPYINKSKDNNEFFYILYDEVQTDKIVTITQLTVKGDSAYLKYQTCKSKVNQGITTEVVRQIIYKAKMLGINKLIAITSSNNLSSMKVLDRNNFRLKKINKNEIYLNEEYLDCLYMEKQILDEDTTEF